MGFLNDALPDTFGFNPATGISLGWGGGGADPAYGLTGGSGQSSSFGKTGSQDQSTSSSYSYQAPDKVWGAQTPYFENLWGAGAGLMGSGQGQQQGSDMYNFGAQGMQNIMNPGSNPLVDIYAQDLGRAFNENIMPWINREAAGRGMVGGTRQGVAQGLAAGEMSRNLSNFAGSQYQADMDRQLGALSQASQLGNYGMGIPWYGLNQMGGLLGAPVVLDQGGYSTSQSQSSGSSFGKTGSQATDSKFGATGPNQGWVEDQYGMIR